MTPKPLPDRRLATLRQAAALCALLILAKEATAQATRQGDPAFPHVGAATAVLPPAGLVSGPVYVETRRPVPPNCNLALEVTEEFTNRFVSRSEGRQGMIRDCVLGADVYGSQSTHTTTRLDFRPCDRAALVELQLLGLIDSRTVGVTEQAQIHSLGSHQMFFAKEIEFDGVVLKTRSPSAHITPQQRNVAAATRAARIPILGPITGNIALRAANARKPVSTAITAEKITRQAGPAFNDGVDQELARLNRALAEQVRPRLERFDLRPRQQFVSTTDETFQWSLVVGEGPDAGALPLEAARVSSGNAATVSIHQSLLNGSIDRLPLGGIAVSDAAIDQWFTRLLNGQAPSDGDERFSSEPRLATIQFAEQRPIEFRFEPNRTVLILRIGFRPVAGPEIPVQELAIPFTLESKPDALVFRPGEVTISPLDPANTGSLIDEAARQLIRTEVQDRLAARAIPRRIPLDVPDGPRMTLILREVALRDGWLSVALDCCGAEPAGSLDAREHPFIMSTRR
jgi:hypothetical protein